MNTKIEKWYSNIRKSMGLGENSNKTSSIFTDASKDGEFDEISMLLSAKATKVANEKSARGKANKKLEMVLLCAEPDKDVHVCLSTKNNRMLYNGLILQASSNFVDTIFIGKWVNEYNAVGIISHDLLHIACFQIGEDPFWHLLQDEEGSEYVNDPYRQCVKGCLGI